ncbi:MAG: prolipoprotein diacylglyceryl transferase, partial [Clostridia bacterium]|nr:prolipoprotein diacylglyceryl transferase [Clostridia bacterium]
INKRKPIEKQVNFIQLMDVCLCLVILGQAIGRWGNYANGEAYGQLIENPAWQWFPFAVFIQGGKFGTGWYHACFFYESMWNIVGFVLLQIIYNGKRKSFDGFCIAFYCIWYGFIRFFVEGLRSDSMYFGSIKANQLISALIFFAGVSIVVYHIVMAKRVGKKPFIFVKEDELNMDYYGYEKSFIYLKTTFKKDQSSKDTQQVADTVENKNDDLGDEK